MNPWERFVKSWRIDELLPFAKTAYRELEELLQVPLYHELPIIRHIPNHEKEIIAEKVLTPENGNYISRFTASKNIGAQ